MQAQNNSHFYIAYFIYFLYNITGKSTNKEVNKMDLLKKVFPFSFAAKKDLATLIIHILIYLVAGLIGGCIVGFLAKLPIIGFIFGLVGSLISIYGIAGIVLSCLDYFKILK